MAAMLQTGSSPSAPIQGRSWGPSLDGVYYWVSGYVLTLGSYFLHMLCLSSLSKTVWVYSRHALSHASTLKAETVFQKYLLAKSINTHRLDSSEHYLMPTRATTLSTHATPGMLSLFHSWGICRGMGFWFVYLYFKTRASFTDTDLHMAALGKQFEQGAPAQAAFLHALDLYPAYDLLKLNAREDSKISTSGKTEEQIAASIQAKEPGIYGIYTSAHNSHHVVYIKLDAERQYLFDSNVGVVKVSSPALMKAALESPLSHHDSSKEIVIDQYSPR